MPYQPTRLTVSRASAIVAESGCRLTVTEFREYRLADRYDEMAKRFPDETRAQIIERIELRAYYTNDLADAVATAKHYRPSLPTACD